MRNTLLAAVAAIAIVATGVVSNAQDNPQRRPAEEPAAPTPQPRPAELQPREAPAARAGAMAPGQNRGEPRVTGKLRMSSEHAGRVRDLLSHNAHRERAPFAIEVGARVPDSVALSLLPPDVIVLAPEYRGYDYFVDDNDVIVFVSPETHEIVGAIDYEGRAAAQ